MNRKILKLVTLMLSIVMLAVPFTAYAYEGGNPDAVVSSSVGYGDFVFGKDAETGGAGIYGLK